MFRMTKYVLIASCALLYAALARSQSAVNEPGTPIDVTARDLQANEIRNNWLTYHGDSSGHRYSGLKEITRDNIAQLQLKWVFHSRKARVIGAVPVVVAGVMYVTASNDLFAIDARTGAVLWHHTRQDATGAKEDESAHINRGVAVLHNRLFMEADDDHLLALDARSGNVLWDVPYADKPAGYGGVSAPLAVRHSVLVGTSDGAIASFDGASGREVWRFATRSAHQSETPSSAVSPVYGDRNSMTGTYDPDLDIVYWELGGESCTSETNAQPRRGGCLLALDASTGELKWKAPLPSHEFSGASISEVPMLVDAVYQGTSRKLVIAAHSDGFTAILDIFDRETGKLVSRRQLDTQPSAPVESQPPNAAAAKQQSHGDALPACSVDNILPSWNPPSYSEQTRYFYFMNFEDCRTRPLYGGSLQPAREDGSKLRLKPGPVDGSTLVAYDPAGDRFVWKSDLARIDHPPTGVTTTVSGLLLSSGQAQSFQATDAATGKVLWSFPMGQSPTGSPMTYGIEGHQYIAIAAGNDLFVFGLP